MFVRTVTSLILGSLLFFLVLWGTGMLPAIAKDGNSMEAETKQKEEKQRQQVEEQIRTKRDVGPALYAMAQLPNTQQPISQEPNGITKDPIVIPNAHLNVIQKEDVPSQRDGVLRIIGTEIPAADRAKYPGQVVEYMVGNGPRYYRRLKEGDTVKEGDVVALLDDDLSRAELASKIAKRLSADAELQSSEKTRDESYQRWLTAKQLRASKVQAMSLEDLRGAELTYYRYVYEAKGKEQAIRVAEEEVNQAKTVLAMYAIKTKISGTIKSVKVKDGESIKALDSVMQIANTDRLRVDGLVDIQYASELRKGMPITIEPTYRKPPMKTFVGHRGVINSVAVSKDPQKTYIVSGSEEDGMVMVWSRASSMPLRLYPHHAAVKVVTCSPVGGEVNLCLTGDENGQARVFDLNTDTDKPICEMKERHKKKITAAAFSPDGKVCATAGDDGIIMLWDPLTGAAKYSITPSDWGHTNSVTSLTFTPQSELVSAGRDTFIKVWALGTEGAQIKRSIKRQATDLLQVGVSPDGKYYMAEHGKEMRIVSLANDATAAVLRNPSNEFNTLAEFSPNGRMALTCSGLEGLLQLWKLDTERSHEVRQFSTNDHSATTCAAISPDDSFVVAGTKTGSVCVWKMPTTKEVTSSLTGVITSVEQSIELGGDAKVHIIAEVDNPKDEPLYSNDVVTIVARPAN